ncbi:MAG: DUF4307 domain-containing protein [Actinomycetes bacterium]
MHSDESFSYNDRYGVRPANRWVGPAVFFAVVGITWLAWAGLHHSNPNIRTSLISYTATTDREISLRYTVVRKDKNQVLICILIARDYDKNIVGQIDDEIEPGLASFEKTTAIPTRSQAVNADVANCRVK